MKTREYDCKLVLTGENDSSYLQNVHDILAEKL